LIDTGSVLPDISHTNQRLELIDLDEAKIVALIRKLNVNKAHP